MTELNKGSVVFKNKPEDFIVEEVWGDYACKVSDSSSVLEKPRVDLGKLDIGDRKAFLTCELEKMNVDHFTVFSVLSRELNNSAYELGYAGTKDKIAWTCQKISIFNADIERIKKFSVPGILLKNFRWEKHKIKIGDLSGNRFRVVLRDVDKEAIKILNRVRNIEYHPNFFGAQRFGSVRKENVIIGKLILKQKFREAVLAFLTGFGAGESDEVKVAKKKFLSEKNISKAKEYFPQSLRTEHQIIDYLSKNSDDWLGALKLIGEKTLLIMCQAVQSKLFNEVLERALDENVKLEKVNLNLIGYNYNFPPGPIGAIERKVLKENNLEIDDFKVPEMPSLSLRSSTRKAYFSARNVDIETEEDELFKPSKKIVMSFVLDSGIYATTFLEQFFMLR